MAKVASQVSMEAAKTVLEVADLAWAALECRHRYSHHDTEPPSGVFEEDVESLRSENHRLRLVLEKNLTLLQEMSASPALSQNCPPDLHEKLLSAASDGRFLNKLESLRENFDGGATCKFPFDDPSGADLEKVEVLVNVDSEEPSWWVWVSEEMVPRKIEEKSGIDDEAYAIESEEHVVDGVAYFMARCILANPKTQNLTPQELQKALMKAMGGMSTVEKMLNIWHAGMMFYTLAMWGLALARSKFTSEFGLFTMEIKLDGVEGSLILIKQGAEARVFESNFVGRRSIVKERFSKKYRHPSLDSKLTLKRLNAEARCMTKARKLGVSTPVLYAVDQMLNTLTLEFVEGPSLKDILLDFGLQSVVEERLDDIATQIGNAIGKLHDGGLVHGDLTTSNMLIRNGSNQLVLIDFGLSFTSSLPEDKAVDLYVLERALLSMHSSCGNVMEKILNAYRKSSKQWSSTLNKLAQVRQRGRKRTMVG